jgi:hypothetical protein
MHFIAAAAFPEGGNGAEGPPPFDVRILDLDGLPWMSFPLGKYVKGINRRYAYPRPGSYVIELRRDGRILTTSRVVAPDEVIIDLPGT